MSNKFKNAYLQLGTNHPSQPVFLTRPIVLCFIVITSVDCWTIHSSIGAFGGRGHEKTRKKTEHFVPYTFLNHKLPFDPYSMGHYRLHTDKTRSLEYTRNFMFQRWASAERKFNHTFKVFKGSAHSPCSLVMVLSNIPVTVTAERRECPVQTGEDKVFSKVTWHTPPPVVFYVGGGGGWEPIGEGSRGGGGGLGAWRRVALGVCHVMTSIHDNRVGGLICVCVCVCSPSPDWDPGVHV